MRARATSGSCNHGKQLASSHADQGQEVLGRLFFRLRFRSQLSEVLHHAVRINLADGANLVLGFGFTFVFEFLFAFALAETAAGDVANGAEPAFTFRTGFVL